MVLSFDVRPDGIDEEIAIADPSGLVVVVDSTSGTVTVVGPADQASFLAALSTAAYSNSLSSPTEGIRTVQVTITPVDGAPFSDSALVNVFTPCTCANPNFSLTETLNVIRPFNVAFFDDNSDGLSDMAVASFAASTDLVAILAQNETNGSFSPLSNVGPPGGVMRDVHAADINRDGVLDIVFSSENVGLYWYDPVTKSVSLISAETDFFSLDTADVNNDGSLDIVVTRFLDGDVLVYLSDCAMFSCVPSFTLVQIARGSLQRAWSVEFADMDNDGDFDIVATSQVQNLVVVFTNNLLGTTPNFAASLQISSFNKPRGARVGDINGDGVLDIAVADFGTQTVEWIDGATNNVNTVGVVSNTFEVDLKDVNGDGFLDIVGVGRNSAPIFFLNNGMGTSWSTTVLATVSTNPRDVEFVDIDADGDLDLVVVDKDSDSVHIFTSSCCPEA